MAKITELIPDDKNFNKGSAEGQKLIEKSFRKHGAGRSILIDKNNRIIAGNKSVENAVSIGLEDVQIVESDGTRLIAVKRTDIDLNSPEGREMALADNASAKANIIFDVELVEAELGEVVCEEWGVETSKKLAAEEDDFNGDPPKEPITVLGDLYELNEHRLHCADSCDSDAVAKTLNNKEPYLMVTDPPYGVNYDPTWRESQATKGFGAKVKAKGKVMNDDIADWTEAWALSPSKVAYVWHGGKVCGLVAESLEKCDFEIRSQIIWVKPSLTFSRGDYHWQHEPCWYAVKRGSKGNWAGDRKQTTTWHIAGINPAGRSQNKDDVVVGHGTQKPIECMARAIGNHDGDVYDPFLGSGTTLIASDQLNRICYGQELDPKYCDVIVARYIKHRKETGSSLVIKRNGQQLSEDEINKYIENTNA